MLIKIFFLILLLTQIFTMRYGRHYQDEHHSWKDRHHKRHKGDYHTFRYRQKGHKSFFQGKEHRPQHPHRKLNFFDQTFTTPFIVPFDFYTFCPSQSSEDFDQYHVAIIAQNITNATTLLFYCGLARLNNQTCDDAFITCTTPGPSFDLTAGKKIGVEWINQVGTVLISPQLSSHQCNKSSPIGDHCYLTTAINDTFPSTDPADLIPGTYGLTFMSRFNIPLSTHIHGLEILPQYDGNPTGWFTKKGDIGSGAVTAEPTQRYKYRSFYQNWQNPGTLWYHDHAMHLTDHNVKYGLAGLWIIRNASIQSGLPYGPLEKYLILGQRNETYVSDQQNQFPQKTPHDRKFHNVNPTRAKVLQSHSDDGYLHLTKNTYRFRMLNAWFEMSFDDLHFIITTPSDQQGKRLNFTIIGADSSVMAQPEYNVTSISIASAQRYDFLFDLRNVEAGTIITLNTSNQSNVQGDFQYYIKMVVDDKVIDGYNGDISIDDITLPLNFINLTNFTPTLRRFRPLVATQGFQFSINAHPIYDKAESQHPIIGSIQDWILIDLVVFPVPIPHPIHVHLINYQLIARYSLIYYDVPQTAIHNCTKYAFRYFNITPNLTSPDPCDDTIPDNMDKYQNQFLQNDPNSVPDVFQGCNQNGQGCLYLTNLTSLPIPNWQKNWKETSLVLGGTASVIRIRWAKTQYIAERDGDNYFNYPNEALTAFPGFVYHCHFLPHEDSEMMRPFLMRMPLSNNDETGQANDSDNNNYQ